MPDLQSELAKALAQSQFDDDAGPTPPVVVDSTEPTDQSMRARAWRFVKDNPGVGVRKIAAALGTTTPNIAGGLHKMVQRGNLRRVVAQDGSGFNYFAVGDDYIVMTVEERVASMHRARAAAATKPGPKPGTKRSVKKPKPRPIQWVPERKQEPAASKPFNADEILAGLNVLQAKELLRKLNELFGI